MSNAEVSRRTKIPEKRLGRLMRCERVMRADELVRLCYLFELGLAWFVSPELERELSAISKKKARGGKARR